MSLMPVAEALSRLLDGLAPAASEQVSIDDAYRRVLAEDLIAKRTQPPFPASAMDGFAVRAADIKTVPATLSVIGEAPAGHGYQGRVNAGEAVRIFTGAPVPEGTDTILIQEDAQFSEDRTSVIAQQTAKQGTYVRPAGLDFTEGDALLSKGSVLTVGELSLAASMDYGHVPVFKRPLVAVLATGDELVKPGDVRRPDQIVASNSYGIAAMIRDNGGDVLDLGIAVDTVDAIGEAITRALDAGADLIVTLGGASVGDHDLVQDVLKDHGMSLDFWRIAMRPGKPLMAGSIGKTRILGLPGNPVSSLVCGILFMRPLIRTLAGLTLDNIAEEQAILGASMPENDKRQDYVRATLSRNAEGHLVASPFSRQDSSMLLRYVRSDCLIIRPPFADPIEAGKSCMIIRLR